MSDRNDSDDRWLAEFDRLQKAGKVVLDREEWKAKLEDAYTDGRSSTDSELTHAYANGRADERKSISAVLKEAGFELRVSESGHEFLLNVQAAPGAENESIDDVIEGDVWNAIGSVKCAMATAQRFGKDERHGMLTAALSILEIIWKGK